MFDIGWSEMAIILLVALIVIGPKDLPRVARTAGRWIGKARAMARDFQRSLEDMAREAELDEIKKGIEKVGRTDLKSSIAKTIDPEGELNRAFDFSETDRKPGSGDEAVTAEERIEPATGGTGAGEVAAPTTGAKAGSDISALPASPSEKS